MSVPLLKTKLSVPTVRPALVPRPRLIERLNRGLRSGRKLTLLCAPAGYGKTTLLSEWVSSSKFEFRNSDFEFETAWLSLDDGDNDPARFRAYLAAALQIQGVELEPKVLDAELSPQLSTVEEFITTLLNQVAATCENMVLILDDYHLISTQQIHDTIEFLLDHMPDNLHLVIAGRADPPLPLARLRGRGLLAELRQTDLRFTPEEAAAFLNRVLDLDLSADDAAALTTRTEGWAAGLQMAAISLQGRDDVSGFVRSFTGSNRYVLDYLVEEVWQRQPEAVQQFLLRTCILEQLCAPLCDAVRFGFADVPPCGGEAEPATSRFAPDSQEMLEHLERANLFVLPLDDRREWYRYHRLFADLLRNRLEKARPDLVPELHRRASSWYEQHGDVEAAIEHALAAADTGRAADLIERVAERTMMGGELATLLHWLEALPRETVHSRPALCIMHAWLFALSGRPLAEIESRLREAERYSEAIPGQVLALRALVAALQVQIPNTVEFAQRALDHLPEDAVFLRSFMLWILSTYDVAASSAATSDQSLYDVARLGLHTGNLTIAVSALGQLAELYARRGQMRRAWDLYQRALELATNAQGRRLPIAGQALVGLADLAWEWNDLSASTRYLEEGIALIEQWNKAGSLEAMLYLARTQLVQGDEKGARESILKAEQLAIQFDATDLDDILVALFQARLSLTQGNTEAARRWAEQRGLYTYIDTPLTEESDTHFQERLRKYELVGLARLLLAQGRPEPALRVLDSVLELARRRGRPALIIECTILKALACRAQGYLDQALDTLVQALGLAEPEGYVRRFVDEGEPLRDLLATLSQRHPDVYPGYVNKLLSALGAAATLAETPTTTAPQTAPGLAEPLSQREMEVLHLLPTGRSTSEIARVLVISVHTVRSHLKSIYGKLGVHSRHEAVARAQELNLL